MKTAVIYARYSSDKQTEQSIEGQLHVCEDYAKHNDIVIVGTYIDRAMTGTNDHRPGFQNMIKDSKNKNWNYVLVYKLDRFSRNRFEAIKYKQYLKGLEIKVLSATENISDTPEGKFMESIIEGYNEFYSNELSQKVQRGMNETRMKGYFTGGRILYGYKVENRKIVIDEDNAKIVKFIFEQYASGKYVREIVKELTEKGIYKKGKPFAANKIFDMLKNTRYIGKYNVNGQDYNELYPAIIDEDLFYKAREICKANKPGKQSIKTTYLLRNKVICGYCGKKLCGECGISRHGKTLNYYKCSGIKTFRNGCNKESIRKEILEEFVVNSIIEELTKPDFLDKITKIILDLQANEESKNVELDILLKTKNKLQTSLENIMDAVENGLVNKTTQDRILKIEKQLDDVESQILIEKNKKVEFLTKEEIKEYYIDTLKESPKILIDKLINKVIAYNDKIEIIFKTPNGKNSEEKLQDSFFYCKKKEMKKSKCNNDTITIVEIEIYYYI